jgi:hypothetical protein
MTFKMQQRLVFKKRFAAHILLVRVQEAKTLIYIRNSRPNLFVSPSLCPVSVSVSVSVSVYVFVSVAVSVSVSVSRMFTTRVENLAQVLSC